LVLTFLSYFAIASNSCFCCRRTRLKTPLFPYTTLFRSSFNRPRGGPPPPPPPAGDPVSRSGQDAVRSAAVERPACVPDPGLSLVLSSVRDNVDTVPDRCPRSQSLRSAIRRASPRRMGRRGRLRGGRWTRTAGSTRPG